MPERSIGSRAPQVFPHLERRRQQHRRPDLRLEDEMPDDNQADEEERRVEEPFHFIALSASCPTCLSERMIFAAVLARPALLRSRGRSRSMTNSSWTRPGWGEKRMTRSPRHAASRTLCVTKTMVLFRACQMRWMSP